MADAMFLISLLSLCFVLEWWYWHHWLLLSV